ncbi:MAG: mevalonate kinase, partial [Woeseiaceae bacterium]|nr:mevalonate kinase [Woeseiaceae bacterium]
VRMGTVGGSVKANPAAAAGLCIAAVSSSQELGELMTAVGLAQNLAALKALATDGIQRGHMRLHARSVALAADVPRHLQDRVVRSMIDSERISESKARQIVAEIESAQRDPGDTALGRGSASGKVILLGEHAVVYGRPAVALPLPEAISASLYASSSGTTLRIPSWNLEQELGQDAADGAMALLQLVIRHLGLESQRFLMHVDARIPPAAGLGASAALAVAMIRALDSAYSLGMNDKTVNDLAFECETISHGTPSGIDNSVAVSGKAMVFRRKGPRRIRELSLDRLPPLVIAWSGTRGSTRQQVEAVRERWLKAKAAHERIFDEIGQISLEGARALGKGDDARLGSLMNIAHGLLNALQVSTPLIEEMVDIARSGGAAGAKLTGAGGGGSIVALCPGTTEEVSGALSAAGFEVISGFAVTGGRDEQG